MIYALLIRDGIAEDEPWPEGVADALMEEHRELQRATKQSGEFLGSARLEKASHASTLHADHAQIEVVDGPYVEAKEWLAGFYLLECESIEKAREHAEKICPPRGSIEVRPVSWHDLSS